MPHMSRIRRSLPGVFFHKWHKCPCHMSFGQLFSGNEVQMSMDSMDDLHQMIHGRKQCKSNEWTNSNKLNSKHEHQSTLAKLNQTCLVGPCCVRGYVHSTSLCRLCRLCPLNALSMVKAPQTSETSKHIRTTNWKNKQTNNQNQNIQRLSWDKREWHGICIGIGISKRNRTWQLGFPGCLWSNFMDCSRLRF